MASGEKELFQRYFVRLFYYQTVYHIFIAIKYHIRRDNNLHNEYLEATSRLLDEMIVQNHYYLPKQHTYSVVIIHKQLYAIITL